MSQKKIGSQADYKSGNYADKQFIFRLASFNRDPSYTKADGRKVHYPPRIAFPCIDSIFDEDSKGIKPIFYKTGSQDIFDAPSLNTKPEDRPRPYVVEFKDGLFIVDGRQRVLLDFMMKSNYNGSNEKRMETNSDGNIVKVFVFVDKSINIDKTMNLDMLKHEALDWCYKEDFDNVLAYARVKLTTVKGLDDKEVRYNLKVVAESDPKGFLDGISNPIFKRKSIVIDAVDRGILKVDARARTIAWTSNPSQPISIAASGVDPIDNFVQGSLTDDGEIVYKHLLTIMTPQEVGEAVVNPVLPNIQEVKAAAEPLPKPLVATSSENYKELHTIYEKAIGSGILTLNRGWHELNGEKIQASKEKFLIKMQGDPELLQDIKDALNKA